MRRCDLQVHSKYSDQPAEWILRKVGVPESYTSPSVIYDSLHKRGFAYVTITDYNRIDGCLEIADRPGVFISEKVTAHFPEDHCKVNLLVWNIDEAQHRAIQSLRRNIYELTDYLRAGNIAHGVASPLTSVNALLDVDHIEKLLLMFRVFDGVNHSTASIQQEVFRYIVDRLDAESFAAMAERQGVKPFASPEERPWQKVLIGGSDDHAGLNLGGAWTEADRDAVDSPADFLNCVMTGRVRVGGGPTDVARFSASLYKIIFSYASDQLRSTAPNGAALLERVADRFLAGQNPAQLSFGERMGHFFEAVRTGKAFDLLNPKDLSLNRELTKYFLDGKVKKEIDDVIRAEKSPERRSFRVASKIANDLIYRLFHQVLDRVQCQQYLEALQPASGMLPVAASVAPYLFSYFNLYGNRPLLERAARRLGGDGPTCLKNDRRAWFTDTLEDVNGVARTIRTMTRAAQQAGRDLTVVTSRANCRINDIPLENFPPVGEFELPEYKLQKLSFPPILDMIDYIETRRITECVISTPGPVGLTALAGAKLMGLRTTGIYHTDFPQYVRILTDDSFMETMMWNYMHWFYSQLDLIYVNSQFYKECWMARGIPEKKLKILPRGLDTELFNHDRRIKDFWTRRGATAPVLLYVGRVSKEKELEFLCRVVATLRERGVRADLAVVGDGPYIDEMRSILPDALFTGILDGEELAAAYASADLFVFPSTTDTFGNVVIEAMSSGIPAFVSDIGGPCELVEDGVNGRVLAANNLTAWTDAIAAALQTPATMERRIAEARRVQDRWCWTRAFDRFWEEGLAT